MFERIAVSAILVILGFLIAPRWSTISRLLDRNPDNTLPNSEIVAPNDLATDSSNGILIYFERLGFDSQGRTVLHYVIANQGSSPVYYSGYPPTEFRPRPPEGEVHPFYQIQAKSDSGWKTRKTRWCGTGSERIRLKPGFAGRFIVHQFAEEPGIRVGVYCSPSKEFTYSEGEIVWSSPYVAETQTPDPNEARTEK
ncbi:MAG: hypothetical protein ACKVT0_20425 [Planctomycetaceae bacterium]